MTLEHTEHDGEKRDIIHTRNPNRVVVSDITEALAWFRRTIKLWDRMDHPRQNAVIFSMDALPGAGKSTLLPQVKALAENEFPHLPFMEIPEDAFLGTDRDSPERQMLADPALPNKQFWELFFQRDEIIRTLEAAARTNGEASVVKLEKKYNRATGRREPGTLKIPAGRKVVVLEGVNSTSMLRDASLDSRAKPFSMMIHVDPALALERSVKRDAAAGRRTEEEARRLRTGENRHILPELGRNMDQVDMVYRME